MRRLFPPQPNSTACRSCVTITPRLPDGTLAEVTDPPLPVVFVPLLPNVNVVSDGTDAIVQVALNAATELPAIVTTSPVCRPWWKSVVTVTMLETRAAVTMSEYPTICAFCSPTPQCKRRPSLDATARMSSPQLSIVQVNSRVKNAENGRRSASVSSAVPPDDDAFAAVCENVNVVDDGTLATANVPLNELSVTPEMTTLTPTMKLCGVDVVIVTTFDERTAVEIDTVPTSRPYSRSL